MRTSEEILAHMDEVRNDDFFGTIQSDLLKFLPFDLAKPFLKDTATEGDWAQVLKTNDEATIKALMLEYMPFAWGKANDCRGLSAGRSINHMEAWLWLLGEDDAARNVGEYEMYGKPQLRAICEHYEWDWTAWDDGQWGSYEEGPFFSPAAVGPIPLGFK